MGYEGGRIAPWVERAKEATDRANRDIAEEGGRRMVAWTKRNTPVERFLKDLAHPYHLRDKIDLKLLRVYTITGGSVVYESGAETTVEYAPYVEEGTGKWGPSHAPYIIRPKNPFGFLSWIASKPFTRRDGTHVRVGDRVFAKEVLHPGSPGAHMFAIGAAMVEHEFEQFAGGRLEEWAREVERLA